MKKTVSYIILCISFLVGCETESYETGQGKYSLMQADFVELSVDAQKQATGFTTDEGEKYALTTPVTASWILRPDTTYRAIIYYNKVGEGKAEKVSMGAMGVLSPIDHWRFKSQPQDPLGVESIWLTKNRKYINMGLLLKNGRIDDEEGVHAIAMSCDTIIVNADKSRTAYYRLLHDQGDAPEYYTNRRYVSILIPGDRPDSINLSIQTYDGVLRKILPLK